MNDQDNKLTEEQKNFKKPDLKPAEKTAVELMAEVMLKREMRQAAIEEKQIADTAQKQKQRDFNAKSHYNDHLVLQAGCRHLKGGKNRIRTQAKDYAVYLHTYINTERVIRCFVCNMKWKPDDTKEFLLRDGKQVPNHTKLGWEDAIMMVNETSNTPSASEIPLNVAPKVEPSEFV